MIRTFPIYRLLGRTTVEQFLSLVRASLNEHDNQRLQDLTLRLYLNAAKEELHEKLLATSYPAFDYIFHAKDEPVEFLGTEPANTLTYADYNDNVFANLNNRFNIKVIDLGLEIPFTNTPLTGLQDFYGMDMIVPMEHIKTIKAVSLIGHGLAKPVSYQELMNVAHTRTVIWDYSILWANVNDKILIYNGIKSLDVPDTTNDTAIKSFKEAIDYEILVTRRSLEDDLLMPDQSNTYRLSIDMPTNVLKTLVAMVQKACLESLGKTIMPQIDQAIDASMQNQTQTLMNNAQMGIR